MCSENIGINEKILIGFALCQLWVFLWAPSLLSNVVVIVYLCIEAFGVLIYEFNENRRPKKGEENAPSEI